MAQVTYSLKIDAETDGDLVRWLDRQPNKSEAIRAALREHLQGVGVTLGDVLQAVRNLERCVKSGGVIVRDGGTPGGSDTSDEPPDVAAALDALAEM